jgi:hypothetical protein
MTTGSKRHWPRRLAPVISFKAKGIAAVRAKTGAPAAQRLSRLLILASDGTPRFYHDADSLLAKHSDRLWAVKVDATGEVLGRALTQKGGRALALMIDDKDAICLALSRLADHLR